MWSSILDLGWELLLGVDQMPSCTAALNCTQSSYTQEELSIGSTSTCDSLWDSHLWQKGNKNMFLGAGDTISARNQIDKIVPCCSCWRTRCAAGEKRSLGFHEFFFKVLAVMLADIITNSWIAVLSFLCHQETCLCIMVFFLAEKLYLKFHPNVQLENIFCCKNSYTIFFIWSIIIDE